MEHRREAGLCRTHPTDRAAARGAACGQFHGDRCRAGDSLQHDFHASGHLVVFRRVVHSLGRRRPVAAELRRFGRCLDAGRIGARRVRRCERRAARLRSPENPAGGLRRTADLLRVGGASGQRRSEHRPVHDDPRDRHPLGVRGRRGPGGVRPRRWIPARRRFDRPVRRREGLPAQLQFLQRLSGGAFGQVRHDARLFRRRHGDRPDERIRPFHQQILRAHPLRAALRPPEQPPAEYLRLQRQGQRGQPVRAVPGAEDSRGGLREARRHGPGIGSRVSGCRRVRRLYRRGDGRPRDLCHGGRCDRLDQLPAAALGGGGKILCAVVRLQDEQRIVGGHCSEEFPAVPRDAWFRAGESLRGVHRRQRDHFLHRRRGQRHALGLRHPDRYGHARLLGRGTDHGPASGCGGHSDPVCGLCQDDLQGPDAARHGRGNTGAARHVGGGADGRRAARHRHVLRAGPRRGYGFLCGENPYCYFGF